MCEIGKKFTDIQYYNKEMQKGMEDKLFFLDKLPKNQHYAFVDFGCADGSMINALTSILEGKNHIYIGYDISETMIDLAKTNYHGPSNANVIFTNNWDDVNVKMTETLITTNYKSVLILSSVIHEVYSYSKNQDDIKEFWNRVLNTGFNYIIIRDMCPSEDINRNANKDLVFKVMHNADALQIDDFISKWGTIDNNKNLIHFLLKYRWKVNWKRECSENYFPVTIQMLSAYFQNFNVDYFERFRVPFLEKCWKEDYNIEIEDYTHIKAIFVKKKI